MHPCPSAPVITCRLFLLLGALAGLAPAGFAQLPNQTEGKPAMLLYPEKLKLLLTWQQDGNEIQPVLDPSFPPLPGKSGTLASRTLPGKLLEVGPDGKFLDGIDKAAVFKLDRNGAIVPTAAAETHQSRFFVGQRRYVAELPSILRDAPGHVEIAFSGTARATPEAGTVFNLDGAGVGFLRLTAEAGRSPAGIELVARTLDARNQPVWQPTGLVLSNRAVDELVDTGPFTIELDHARGVWAIYRGDKPLVKDLHLFTQGPRPTALATAGQEDDLAVLYSFSILPLGPVKSPQPKAVDGKFILPDGTTIPAP